MRRLAALFLSVLLITSAVPEASGQGNVRISGADRYWTAVEVSRTGWEYADTVILARGDHYADALTGVPLAHQLSAPILLTYPNQLHSAAAAELERLGAREVILLGGDRAISAAVAEELINKGLRVVRLSGKDRYATAAEVAKLIAPAGADRAILVSGENYPDAMAAAPYAAAFSLPILLAKRDSLPEATKKAFDTIGCSQVLVIGGNAALSNEVENELNNVLRLYGRTRYDTSVELAQYFMPQGGHYYFASGRGFADALTGAVLAAQKGGGLLLVDSKLSQSTADYIMTRVEDYSILGGANAISQDVVNSINLSFVPRSGSLSGWTEPGTSVRIGIREVFAGADGFFELTGLTDGPKLVEFRKAGYTSTRRTVNVSQGRTSIVKVPLIELSAGEIVVFGTVIDRAGLPIAGASVNIKVWDPGWQVWDSVEQTETGMDGRFYLTNSTGQFDFFSLICITVDKDGFEPIQKICGLAGDNVENNVPGLHLRRLGASSVSGKITSNGQAVPGANIILLALGGNVVGTAVSDMNGEYALSELVVPAGTYTIVVETEQFGKYVNSLPLIEGSEMQLNPELYWGSKVVFHLAPEELFIGGTRAFFGLGSYTARIFEGTNEIMTAVWEHAEGEIITFEFPYPVKPGPYTLSISGDFVVDKSWGVTVNQIDTNLSGRANVAGSIGGVVTDKEGTPVPDAIVSVTSQSGVIIETQTGPNGRYLFSGLPLGQYQIACTKFRFETAVIKQVLATANTKTSLDITLKEAKLTSTVQGYVRASGTLKAAEGAKVFLLREEPGQNSENTIFRCTKKTVVDSDGFYQLKELPAGNYTLLIKHPGFYETTAVNVMAKPGCTVEMDKILLEPGGKATLSITVGGAGGPEMVKVIDSWGLEEKGEIRGDKLVLSGLPAGEYVIQVDQEGYSQVHQSVNIAKNDSLSAEINLTLIKTHLVFFQVYGTRNLPLSNALIRIFSKEGQLAGAFETDNSGLSIVELSDGDYYAWVMSDGYFLGSRVFSIEGKPVYVPIIQLDQWQ